MRFTLTTPTTSYPIIVRTNSVRHFPFPDDVIVMYDRALDASVRKLFPGRRRLPVRIHERMKRLATIEHICTQLVQLGCDRSTSIIAVGGGVLGDMVGFAASIYMRGIPYYHVPTTLLAMVDSSIGGKTGVDLAAGKNLVGTVYQPAAVVIDPTFLQTLSRQQFSNGMAEVVKHGILFPPLFRWLETNQAAIIARRPKILERMIALNVEVKAGIVEQDEREHSERMLLNLGHTFGHALEKVSQYRIAHGQAVAYGLAYASAYSQLPERARLLHLLEQFGLKTEPPRRYAPQRLVQAMQADKKHQGNTLTFVLPKALGEIVICRRIRPSTIIDFLCRYHNRPLSR